jgi:hypothetical protein
VCDMHGGKIPAAPNAEQSIFGGSVTGEAYALSIQKDAKPLIGSMSDHGGVSGSLYRPGEGLRGQSASCPRPGTPAVSKTQPNPCA